MAIKPVITVMIKSVFFSLMAMSIGCGYFGKDDDNSDPYAQFQGQGPAAGPGPGVQGPGGPGYGPGNGGGGGQFSSQARQAFINCVSRARQQSGNDQACYNVRGQSTMSLNQYLSQGGNGGGQQQQMGYRPAVYNPPGREGNGFINTQYNPQGQMQGQQQEQQQEEPAKPYYPPGSSTPYIPPGTQQGNGQQQQQGGDQGPSAPMVGKYTGPIPQQGQQQQQNQQMGNQAIESYFNSYLPQRPPQDISMMIQAWSRGY